MNGLLNWFKTHKFEAHLLSFFLMILPSAGMYYAAQAGADSLILGLLGLVAAGNLLAIAIR